MRSLVLYILLILFWGCQDKKPKNDQNKISKSNWAFPHFSKVDSLNPILRPSPLLEFTDPISRNTIKWEERNVLNPTALVKNDTVFLLYRAQDENGTSRIGLAHSTDGLHFIKHASPIFYPNNDQMLNYEWNFKKSLKPYKDSLKLKGTYFDGTEDPRIIESEDGEYIMTYTSYDGKTARLCLATSKDLKNWTKHGLVLKEEKDTWSKSGAIVGELVNDKIIAKKIKGEYWMYFGDTNLFMASSNDLIDWKIARSEESGKMISVLHPRPGYFDSRLVEPGPYALLKEEGILLIYNGSNAQNYSDNEIPKFTYAAGQALFDKEIPYKLINRTDDYFIHPDKDYEKIGEVNEVCFVEGLVFYKNKWFLYYGTADSKIAVAVYE